MMILHTETLKRWGGQQNRVLLESIGLQKRGHHVIIACHRSSMLAEKSRDAGIKTYEVNMVKQAHLSTIPRLPVKCRNGKWLTGKLPIYSSVLFSRIYLGIRTG